MGEAERGDHSARRAYEAIAPVYDAFTAHHDYEAWLRELLPGLERHGLSGDRLLDVGCGTGKSFVPMLERGWRVTACDLSPAMVERARVKAGDATRVETADMRALPRFGEFDLVWALDDAVNYLLSGEDLRAALGGMRANLAASGLLMFDLNTLHTYRTFYAETETSERDGLRLVWEGTTDPAVRPGSVCSAWVHATDAKRGVEIAPRQHRQRHFPQSEAVASLAGAGLECLDVFGQHEDGRGLQQPLDEDRHTKAVYVARLARSLSPSAVPG